MSIKRLNADERALYLIGVAVMRQIKEAPRDPDTQREIDAVLRWIEHWLAVEDQWAVTVGTGLTFDEDFADELNRDMPREGSGDDDIPI